MQSAPAWRRSTVALAPALLIALVAYCGAMGWTIWLPFTNSRMLPSSVFVGLRQESGLRPINPLAGLRHQHSHLRPLFISFALVLGFLLRRADRSAGARREPAAFGFLDPSSMSFIVTGLAWRWLLNPNSVSKRSCVISAWQASSSLDGAAGARNLHAGRAPRSGMPERAGHGDRARRDYAEDDPGTAGRRHAWTGSRPGASIISSWCRCLGGAPRAPSSCSRQVWRGSTNLVGSEVPTATWHRLRGSRQVRDGSPVRSRQCRPWRQRPRRRC